MSQWLREMKMRFLGRTCLIVLSLLPAVSTQDAWTVVGSDQPVIAEAGGDVILPCHISPSISAVDMEVRWFRERFDKPVHLYLNQNDRLSRQDSDYQDRTALSPSALQTGDISLHLRNLRYSDRGVYTCSADDGRWAEDGQTELIVEGGRTVVGSDQPVIAYPGDDVILPCHISPSISAVDMEVRWFRERFDKPVHLYLNQNDRLSRQDSDYQDRTALSPSALQTGDISLHLRNLRYSDRGVYTCSADDGRWAEDGQTELIVEVGWRVVGSDQPVIADPGDNVVLPCHISPRVSAVDMEVRWFREIFDRPVHLYLNQRDRLSRQDGAYWHRTALSPSALQTGDISLHLRNLQPSDRGVYTCLADDGRRNEEGQTEVIVAALGTQPSISMVSTQGEQTWLVCRSEGWSPEPEVIWRDRDGNDVTSLSSTTVQRDSQGLLSVSSYIKIKQQSNVFSCLVRSKIPKPDWESKLHISSDFFPGVSGWMVAFSLTLALSIGAIPLLVIQWRRMDGMERQFEPMAALHLLKELESVKREVLKSEWKWILSSAVDVTLDPDTLHPQLTLSVDGKQVRRGETHQDLPDNPERFDHRFCVLGKEGFTSGRQYWQVQVGGNTEWRLGVIRESAKRKGGFIMTPQQGYWTVEWNGYEVEFTALTYPRTPLPLSLKPQKMGVYLDYEERQLSFYNVESRFHIDTFTDMEFNPNEKLYPLFWTLDRKIDLVLEPPNPYPNPNPVSAAD
ncbi:butyrophilin subfamily 3 member A1-like isoform X2 [Acipenser ruthenus]|uniref:butyrophilin subfamily 3 member A1-like isoform X2 n=1 Tax=Acipenser ruthenus TaxID=7906 RepID=UPI002740DC6D|nr:butyrophilin subfamily 3 member A1-like isoform X2 [Acipenser ruthenus]